MEKEKEFSNIQRTLLKERKKNQELIKQQSEFEHQERQIGESKEEINQLRLQHKMELKDFEDEIHNLKLEVKMGGRNKLTAGNSLH